MAVKLGDTVVDWISNFSGVATGKLEHLNGPIQFGVTRRGLSDGKPVVEWFDEWRLRVLGEACSHEAPPSVVVTAKGSDG